ncbi:hypothetical protein GlitD10_2310 [Gloeomargarita lithophora Alchichica-D10]|uniref:DUF2281 domain-containing protein n=1 Tax=Gloeomargarita lithophora Alchichica-D10 TaxID=1188229 RepID=A0A1J0AFD2_9CYAN|nr:hypothetical protein [Gloeomargarita lithophora]APB34644.1 hypothetical protein GlitD10_2310 [Gloeomargarita lithophora Alchichica-D10]
MTIRETVIAKIQQLPESLLEDISAFIDFIIRNSQAKTVIDSLEDNYSDAWALWFEATDSLEITPQDIPKVPNSEYQQRLLSKYRQQGLDL